MSGNDDLSTYVITVPDTADFGRLRRIPFFNAFAGDDDLTTVVRSGAWLGCPAGVTLMREGELGHDFFVLARGSVQVRKQGKVLGEVGQGEILGEMGALLHEKRSADAVTAGDAILFRLHVTALNQLPLAVVFPLMVHIYKVTAKRLRVADGKLAMM